MLYDRGVEVAIELPESKAVRNLMRRYRFGAALHALSDQQALDWLTEQSAAYRGERPAHYQPRLLRSVDGGIEEQASDRLASIKVVHRPTEENAVSAADWWHEPEIKALLETHLGAKANLIAPGIILEALMNAVRHPKATAIVTAGFLNTRASRRHPNGLLTIAVWDDGESIASTLGAALEERRPLRYEDFSLYYAWYGLYLAHSHAERKRWSHKLFSGATVSANAGEPDLLVAATFPGITSDPGGGQSASALGQYGPKYDRPGMGLYILTSLAVDSFGGEVLIRSGGAYANITRAPRSLQEKAGCHYRVGLVAAPEMGEYFTGNYIVARLPLIAS